MKGFSGCSGLVATILGLALAGGAAAQETVPLRTRNLSPLVAIFGLPTWEADLGAGAREFALVGELASHFRLGGLGGEELVLDGETWRASFLYKHGLARDWTISVEMPIVRHGGGILDDVIDAWHTTFNLPDGNRNLLEEGRVDYRYTDRGVTAFRITKSSNSLGDAQVGLARRIGTSGTLLRAILKLPTGDEDVLAGSGGTDLSLTVLRRGRTTWGRQDIGYYWGLGLMLLGETEFLSDRSEDMAVLGVFGGSWQPFASIGLKAQLDYHSHFYSSALDELGKNSIQASIGGWWAIDSRRTLSFAINEDLVVRTAPDVSIHIDFSWAL